MYWWESNLGLSSVDPIIRYHDKYTMLLKISLETIFMFSTKIYLPWNIASQKFLYCNFWKIKWYLMFYQLAQDTFTSRKEVYDIRRLKIDYMECCPQKLVNKKHNNKNKVLWPIILVLDFRNHIMVITSITTHFRLYQKINIGILR